MFPKPKLIVKKELKQRTIFVEYADDKYCKYVVVDVFETNMVQEPKFFNFKKYFGYMIMVLANIVGLYFASEKLFIILHTSVVFVGLIFWILSHVEEEANFENHNQL